MYSMINVINTAVKLCMKVVKKVNPKSSYHTKYFLNSLILYLGDDGCSLNLLCNNFMMLSQIITLYT